jgi:hypothetical protein
VTLCEINAFVANIHDAKIDNTKIK